MESGEKIFLEGDLVMHIAMPQWGIGRVLEVIAEKVRVCFLHAGDKLISIGDEPRLKKAIADEETIARLEALAMPKEKNSSSKRAAKKKVLKYSSLQYLIDEFLRVFREGFQGEDYMKNERGYKLAACNAFHEKLGSELFSGLMDNNEHQEICARSLYLINKSNLVHYQETLKLSNALKAQSNQPMFAEALYTLLYGQGVYEKRFNAFVKMLDEVGASTWTLATYFPYLMDPTKHIFLKPTVTVDVSRACAFELHYRPEPNWITCRRLLEFGEYLFEQLEDLTPRDMIDVQSFIWCAPRMAEGKYAKDL